MFTYSYRAESEVENVFGLLENIKRGFYQENRLYLLSYMPEKSRLRVVLIPNFAEHIVEIREIMKSKAVEPISENLRRYIDNEAKILFKKYKRNFDRLAKDWSENHEEFENSFYEAFPNLTTAKIRIVPNIFGTLGGYDYSENEITVSPRFDRTISNLFQLTINAAVHYSYYYENGVLNQELWLEKQAKVKEILESRKFAYVVKKYKGFDKSLRSHSVGKLVHDSVMNYEQLGFPIKTLIKSSEQISSLTSSEKAILEALIAQKPDVLSFDEIAEIMWRERLSEKFSLYAITKRMEIIKTKIADTGITTKLIHTERGEGYVLFD